MPPSTVPSCGVAVALTTRSESPNGTRSIALCLVNLLFTRTDKPGCSGGPPTQPHCG